MSSICDKENYLFSKLFILNQTTDKNKRNDIVKELCNHIDENIYNEDVIYNISSILSSRKYMLCIRDAINIRHYDYYILLDMNEEIKCINIIQEYIEEVKNSNTYLLK